MPSNFIPQIYVDQRELRSSAAKELEKLNCNLKFVTLSVGDYIVSDRVAFERKDIDDLMKSWIEDRKLFGQVSDLAHSYERPVLIIEGGDPFFTGRRINPNAVQGMLNTIAISFRVPTLYSLNPAETAKIIYMIAKREQDTEDKRYFNPHGKRSHLSLQEKREYIISAIPDIGIATAKLLLQKFGSVQAVMGADIDTLQEVDGIGKKTAQHIRDIVG